jgi:hypothetical protein
MIGAGFSRNAVARGAGIEPLPLWHDLASKMQEKLGLGADKPRDPLRIAQLYESAFGRAEFDRFIERAIPDVNHAPSDLHTRLLQLPWADVFTTNYDTLLERAADHAGVRYERILTPRDIPLRRGPRLVKLHGTLGAGGGLIATEEDYRAYPRSHAPFVNLVRQSVMETVFVLIGFTGDDPNFLEWSGWVRDELGELAPKIYLCGFLDSSPAELALLQARRVTPLNLAPLFPDTQDKYARALDWLLAALENGRPGRDIEWAPDRVQKIEERDPPLPSSKKFTVADSHPSADWNTTPISQFVDQANKWRTQRLEYPGWHLAPDIVRDRVAKYLDWGRISIFNRAKELPPIERLHVVYELCWRLDLVLSPIFTPEANSLVGWLEEVDPWKGKMGLENPAFPQAFEIERTKQAWSFLALCVLRTAREDLDTARYLKWRQRLVIAADGDSTLASDLRYEECQFHLNNLDVPSFNASLETWRIASRQPLEKLRLAAFYAEAGDTGKTSELATSVLSELKVGEETAATLALDAWASLLLSCLDWREDAKSAGWKRRLDRAKKHDYDVWGMIEKRQQEVKSPVPYWTPRREKVAGFDPHSISETHHWRGSFSDSEAAWKLLKFIEKAPCPLRIGEAGLMWSYAANAASWVTVGAPDWSVSVLIRAKPEAKLWNEVLGREAIATLDEARTSKLFQKTLQLVARQLASQEAGPSNIGSGLLFGGLEVLSRISFRLKPADLEVFLGRLVTWLCDKNVSGDYDIRKAIWEATKRTILALPPQALTPFIPRILASAIPGEPQLSNPHPEMFDEPFEWLPDCKCIDIADRPSDWGLHVSRMVNYLRGGDPHARRWAFARLNYLSENRWLSPSETDAFADALWSKANSATGLPDIYSYYPRAFMDVPGADKNAAREKVKNLLLKLSFPDWKGANGIPSDVASRTRVLLNQLRNVFIHPTISKSAAGHLALSEEEATTVMDRLLELAPNWFAAMNSQEYQHITAFTSESPSRLAGALTSTLGDSVLPWMTSAPVNAANVERLIIALRDAKYPVVGIVVGALHVLPNVAREVAAWLEIELLTHDEFSLQQAIGAIQRWSAASSDGFVAAPPENIVDSLVSRISTRQPTGLPQALQAAVTMVRDNVFTLRQLQKLILALDHFREETAPSRVRDSYREQNIGRPDVTLLLSSRVYATRLAKSLFQSSNKWDGYQRTILESWRDIAKADPLPEVRLEWEC